MAWDVACLGELVIDLIPHSLRDGEWLYAPSPGGAPGNVAVGLARLGRRTAMLGKVGDEAFGRLIIAALERSGVDTTGLSRVGNEKTRLSVVTLAADGERDFIFYRDNPADSLIDTDDIAPTVISDARMLHVGILLMAAPRSAVAQNHAMQLAQVAGRPIAVDPNFRPSLWPSQEVMVKAARDVMAKATIVKLSEAELRLLGGAGPIEAAVRGLWHRGLKVLAVTKGAGGAELFTAGTRLSCRGYAVDAVDTTAAGDAFMASLMSGFLETGLDCGDDAALAHILRTACGAGALAATKKGAMGSLPSGEEIARFIAGRSENPA